LDDWSAHFHLRRRLQPFDPESGSRDRARPCAFHWPASSPNMQYSFGPLLDERGTTFRLWAPGQSAVDLRLENRKPIAMRRQEAGWWSVRTEALTGARYKFSIDGYDFPDPASREQADDADGWS